jgi:hypothetical protein
MAGRSVRFDWGDGDASATSVSSGRTEVPGLLEPIMGPVIGRRARPIKDRWRAAISANLAG